MIEITDLPHLNASLNAASACLLVAGILFIRARRVAAHKACMITAAACSALFLVSYLIYHFSHILLTRFTGEGWVRPLYYAILTSHTILAAVNLPLIVITLYRAFKNDLAGHRRIARWTFPVWLYVALTGVLVYLMLYQFYPGRVAEAP